MELYELIIEDENTDEVMALSLVENPAIEANWVYFSNQKEVHFATIDEDKRTIVAPVLLFFSIVNNFFCDFSCGTFEFFLVFVRFFASINHCCN